MTLIQNPYACRQLPPWSGRRGFYPAFSEMFIAHLVGRAIRVEADLVDQLFNSNVLPGSDASPVRKYQLPTSRIVGPIGFGSQGGITHRQEGAWIVVVNMSEVPEATSAPFASEAQAGRATSSGKWSLQLSVIKVSRGSSAQIGRSSSSSHYDRRGSCSWGGSSWPR
jgi:hypothetical protein